MKTVVLTLFTVVMTACSTAKAQQPATMSCEKVAFMGLGEAPTFEFPETYKCIGDDAICFLTDKAHSCITKR